MLQIRRICVYCGSSPGEDVEFVEAARAFGRILARERIGLVYGGGCDGLMGECAKSAHEAQGEVIGIIPGFLREIEHACEFGEQIEVATMHERKQKMFELADAFVAFPGGVGTLEEVIEQMTWKQLGRHKKPILLANINGFWDPLRHLINHMRGLKFITEKKNVVVLEADQVEDILWTLRHEERIVTNGQCPSLTDEQVATRF